jgi:predicted nucleic acid-binding protein
MKGDRVFIDTNIIVYAYDIDAGKKHEIAKNIMKDLWHSGLGVLSNQVLQEFFVTATRKIPSPLDITLAKEIIKGLSKWDIILNDADSILDAIELHERYKFSFWDSMIIVAAIKGGASIVLSEDISDKQEIEGVVVKNPFK